MRKTLIAFTALAAILGAMAGQASAATLAPHTDSMVRTVQYYGGPLPFQGEPMQYRGDGDGWRGDRGGDWGRERAWQHREWERRREWHRWHDERRYW